MTATTSLRVARWLLVICLIPPLVYLLGANLFLRFGLPWVFSSTNSVNATARSAWTVWPGVVHVRGLRIVFQDPNLQWSLDLEQVSVKVRLGELLSQTFHATEVTGSGTAFKMRHRIEPESKNEPWVDALPAIPEFPAPAVFEARVPEPPVSDAEYALWSVHLENVDVGVREVWAHLVRYRDDRGGGRARGAFRLKPARTLWVGPASLVLDAGKVTLGKDELARSLSGRITCKVQPFDVRVPEGREVLRFISTELELRGQGVTPDPALRLLLPDSELSLRTTPGVLTLSVQVQRGKFSERSSVTLESPSLFSQYRDFRFDAQQVVARLASEPGERAEASLGFAAAELAAPSSGAVPAKIRGAFAANVTSGLDAAGDVTNVERRLRLEQVDVPEVQLFNALGGPIDFISGALGFSLRATEKQGTLEANGDARLQKLRVRQGGTEARLDGKLTATLADARPSEGSGKLALEALLSRSRIDISSGKYGSLSVSDSGLLRLNAELARAGGGDVRSQFRMQGADLTVARVEATDRREVVAQVKNLRLEGTLDQRAQGTLDAKLSAQSSRLRARIGDTWLRARSNLTLALSRFDPAQESGRITSELVLDEAAAVSEGGSDCPWGTLPNARVKVGLDFTRASALATLSASLARAQFTWGDFRALGRVELSARLDAPDRKRSIGGLDFRVRASDVILKSGANPTAGWDAKLPELVLSGELLSSAKVSGTLTVSAPQAETRIGLTKMQTDFDARTALSSLDLERREARFSGKFSVSNTRLAAGRERIEGWWANIHAESALLIARDNVDLSVPFRADLRDGQPGMAILAAEGSLPALLADALPLRELAVIGSVQRRCRLTNFRVTQASGGPLLGRGLLNSTSEAVNGAFLLRLDDLQAISAGVEVDAGDTGVSLLAGDDWLRERTRVLDESVKRTLEQPCLTPPPECSGEG